MNTKLEAPVVKIAGYLDKVDKDSYIFCPNCTKDPGIIIFTDDVWGYEPHCDECGAKINVAVRKRPPPLKLRKKRKREKGEQVMNRMKSIKCTKCGATGSTKCLHTRSIFQDNFFEAMLSQVLKFHVEPSENGKFWDVKVEFRQLLDRKNATENDAVKQTLERLAETIQALKDGACGSSLETYSCINHDWEYRF